MTRSTVKRNLFDDEASSSYNTRAKPPTPLKTLHEHSHPNSSGFLNPITFPTEQTGRIIDSRDIWLIQNTCTFQGLRNEDPSHHIWHYLSIVDNIQADEATRDTSRLRFFHFSLKGKVAEWLDRIPPTQITTWDELASRFLDYFFSIGRALSWNTEMASGTIFYDNISQDDRRKLDQFAQFRFDSLTEEECNATYTQRAFKKGLSHEADECEQNNPSEQVCLSRGDIYNDPSLLGFYQNNDTSPRGNNKRKEKGEDGPEWIIRSKFKDEFASFMLEKKSHAKGIGDMLVQHQPAPQPSILYQPSKSSNLSFLSRLKKQKKDDEDERLLSIFKQIHINLPFLEAMIHMPKGAKVLKDLLLHKEKLEKAASSVKLSEECSAIIQRSLPQKEGDPGSFTLPCLIGPLAVKNALADLAASINIMPHSLFR
ncbi:hypothetical protein Tco_1296177 [Tanacetum coccineum]